jgi:hypothetical protein
MAKKAKIVILSTDYGRLTPFGTFCPFRDTTEGKEYDVLILEQGERDEEGDVANKQSVVFRDDAGDLAAAHVDYHEGKSFKFIE